MNFSDVLRAHAARNPHAIAARFLRPDRRIGQVGRADASGPGESAMLTYGRLDADATEIAAALHRLGADDEPVALVYPTGPDFLRLVAGCLYSRAVAMPIPLPGASASARRRFVHTVRHARARVVCTDTDHLQDVTSALADQGLSRAVTCVTTHDLRASAAPTPPPPSSSTAALLQYTSGSTAMPRGVVLSHGNLIANQQSLVALMPHPQPHEMVLVGWLPHHHDMGLLGVLLHALFRGGTSVNLTPTSFIKKPACWLHAISAYRACFSTAPNFGYDLCVRRVSDADLADIDLSCWRYAVNGAESVRAGTIRRFVQRFAPVGFRPDTMFPAYGLAEASLIVTGGSVGTGRAIRAFDRAALGRGMARQATTETAVELVSCGLPPAGTDVRIVDPHTHRELSEGHCGEIWVRGGSVAQRYYRDTATTVEAFGATTAAGDGPFLRTGDLGLLSGGELCVTGRRKEVMILNGRTIHPVDIEHEVGLVHPSLGEAPGAAFSVDEGDAERCVVVQGVRESKLGDVQLADLASRIRHRIGKVFGVASTIVLVAPAAISRTTSGKVQRLWMREQYLQGALSPLYQESLQVIEAKES